MNTIPVNVTFRGIHPHEDLVYFVRRSCAVAARQCGDSADRAAWAVIVERQTSGVEPGYTVRVAMARTDDGASVQASQADPDPFLAVRNAFSVLTSRLPQPSVPAGAGSRRAVARRASVPT